MKSQPFCLSLADLSYLHIKAQNINHRWVNSSLVYSWRYFTHLEYGTLSITYEKHARKGPHRHALVTWRQIHFNTHTSKTMSHHMSLGEGEVPFEDRLKSLWCWLWASSKENGKSLHLWLIVVGVANWAAVGLICSTRVEKLLSNMTRQSGKYSENTHRWKEQYGVIKKNKIFWPYSNAGIHFFLVYIYISVAISKNIKFFVIVSIIGLSY